MIVAIEGLDASGKQTQSRKLCDRLQLLPYSKTSLYDFPRRDTPTGDVIHRILTEEILPEKSHARAITLQALMTINRLEMYAVLEDAACSPHHHLVLDRYFVSGIVYGQADGIPVEYLGRIHQTLPSADVWILLDVPAEESARRRPDRRDEYEKRVGLMEQVRASYLEIFERPVFPGAWFVVDGMGPEDEVHERIYNVVNSALIRPS